MGDQEGYAPPTVSRRDVAAAWICCAFVAVVGALTVSISHTDASRRSAYVGVHLPGGDVMRTPDSRDYDFDDEVERVVASPHQTQPPLCSLQEGPRHTAIATSPDSAAPALRC
jgi:hypothetical protein